MKNENAEGQTPLEHEELEKLIPISITTRDELNEYEQFNIAQARVWAYSKLTANLLELTFIKTLHHRMFNKTWKWAGKIRTTNKNIGVDKSQILEELAKLCADTQFWIKNKSYSLDLIAVRFHHRLVWIHPFPNGNGRHARLISDLLVEQLGQEAFTWGMGLNESTEKIRSKYISALRLADQGSYNDLLKFVRA